MLWEDTSCSIGFKLALYGLVITREACYLVVGKSLYLLVTDYSKLREYFCVQWWCFSNTVLAKTKLGIGYIGVPGRAWLST